MSDYEDPRQFLPEDDQGQTLSDVMNEVESDSPPAEVHHKLTSGMERRDSDSGPVDPAQFLGKDAPAPVERSPASDSGGLYGFIHTDQVTTLHRHARDAARRDETAVLGETNAEKKAWSQVIAAAQEMDDAVADVSAAMARANRARQEAVSGAVEPVALPSTADARAHAEHRVTEAYKSVKAARASYDEVVEKSGGDRAKNLQASVPKAAADINERVAGLKAAILSLRGGVDALLDASFAAAPAGRGRTGNPSKADLSSLDAIEAEVEALVKAAESPTKKLLRPSLSERARIAEQARQAVGGLSSEMIGLARTEAAEGYEHTSHSRGIDPATLASAEQRAAAFGGLL